MIADRPKAHRSCLVLQDNFPGFFGFDDHCQDFGLSLLNATARHIPEELDFLLKNLACATGKIG